MTATEFTPLASLLGGGLIGLAAVMLFASHGRIAGISGIASRLILPEPGGDRWGRFAFIAGLVAAPMLVAAASGEAVHQTIAAATPVLVAAGLLVGFGAVLGNGCTSGHGVCGLARLSVRSLVATAVFMAAGLATVFLTRHVL
ncbi:YeeE/YedE family protein [Elioraea rosea]|uniref:YeeE/YedE family protein n=1 Tax=Elioraea rosea TaxID=2492390 RepID=UPI001EF5F292|nr:YeeE/YedE thiosulfate transporter family protein [Elioraea rosea]